MHVVFLGARLPLTKTFVQTNGRLTASPYPQVSRVTSYHEQFTDLAGFRDLLIAHAKADHCLFNGQLMRPLSLESRAGQTFDKPKEWVVFDFDKVPAKDHHEVVATMLPPECQNVSYVVQLSASMFRPDVTSWSGHIFMLLKEPIDQNRLKQWFESLNFTVPALTQAISLSDSLQALHWPLDRTVAYNSKLIYIAPPKCHGFEPAVTSHIELVKKAKSHLVIPAFQPIDTVAIRQKINELRKDIGEEPIEYALKQFDGHEVLEKSGLCEVHGMRTSGDHYLRFNLNGGDSYAYFIDLRNIEVIRNFKGEPYLITKDAAPELYKALRRHAPSAVSKPPLEEGTEVLAFYATNQNSAIRVGAFDPVDRRLKLHGASETAARAWRAEYGLVQKEYLPHYDLVFDPTTEIQFLQGSTRINTFRATNYMAQTASSEKNSTLKDLPPLVDRILRSILGDPNDELLGHFVNWVAFIFRKRKKTGTAWVLNGVEGTGKGTFLNFYLRPLLGHEHVETVQYSNLKQEFNGFLENSLLVAIEEADIRSVENAEDIMSKIKLWITDPIIPIRRMRTDVYTAESYNNFLLSTNTNTPANISGTDRRFNFGERQNKKIQFTPNEILAMSKGEELQAFADMLLRWKLDESAVTKIVDTEARRDAHEATTSINQLIAESVMKGDLAFFIDRMPSDTEAAADFNNRFNTLSMFKALTDQYLTAAHEKRPALVRDEDLFILFRTLIPDTRFFQDSKTWRKRHYKSLGLDVDKQHRVPGKPTERARGLLVEWLMPEGMVAPAQQTASVTPIKPKAKRG